MKNLEKKLIELERLKALIDDALEKKFITDLDLINLSRVEYNYGNINSKVAKEKLLKLIYNCPFLLCDLKNRNENIKAILPSFLEYRYENELNELKNQYKLGYINLYYFRKMESELKYFYFESSKDGEKIFNDSKYKNLYQKVYKFK